MLSFDFLEGEEERIEFIDSVGNLIKGDEIYPEFLNEALANSYSISKYLNKIYEYTSCEYDELLKVDYKCWWAEKFTKTKEKMCSGITVKSKLPANNEIEQQCIVDNMEEYKEWQYKIIALEKRKTFYYDIKESWKTNQQALINISQNMRSEMHSLYVEKQANKDIQKECLYRHIESDFNEEEFDNDNEVKVKKIKKIVKEVEE